MSLLPQDQDQRFLARALELARAAVGRASPNPTVGCVLARGNTVLGEGAHLYDARDHAEIVALKQAASLGHSVRGATAYVTLEPCCYQGRTPPCTAALIRAGVKRVVVGVRDPNPRVDGGGLDILTAHGIEVREGVLGEACAQFHAPFFKLIRTGLPWVMLKLALGSDGATGPEGQSTQVTNPEIQQLAHALRRASEAIVVGRWTVQVDDPMLTDRWHAPTAPHRLALRVVLDSHGQLPENRKVWQAVAGQPVLRAVVEDLPALRGVEDLRLPPSPNGCSLRHLLHELAARGVGRVLFEGGGQLSRNLLAQGLVDEFHRFSSDTPAGGQPVELDLASLPRLRAQVTFQGGSWDVLARS